MIFNLISKAKDLFYNNKNSGLSASDVQGAVDELSNNLGGLKLKKLTVQGTTDEYAQIYVNNVMGAEVILLLRDTVVVNSSPCTLCLESVTSKQFRLRVRKLEDASGVVNTNVVFSVVVAYQ